MSLLNEASSGGGGQLCGGGEEEEVEGWATAAAAMEDGGDVEHRSSPNKRHRATPRPHNIQRPCLDFEKMQQVRCCLVFVTLFDYCGSSLNVQGHKFFLQKWIFVD
jgi:hypothetical protein